MTFKTIITVQFSHSTKLTIKHMFHFPWLSQIYLFKLRFVQICLQTRATHLIWLIGLFLPLISKKNLNREVERIL